MRKHDFCENQVFDDEKTCLLVKNNVADNEKLRFLVEQIDKN
jgi:hypothetical protein